MFLFLFFFLGLKTLNIMVNALVVRVTPKFYSTLINSVDSSHTAEVKVLAAI